MKALEEIYPNSVSLERENMQNSPLRGGGVTEMTRIAPNVDSPESFEQFLKTAGVLDSAALSKKLYSQEVYTLDTLFSLVQKGRLEALLDACNMPFMSKMRLIDYMRELSQKKESSALLSSAWTHSIDREAVQGLLDLMAFTGAFMGGISISILTSFRYDEVRECTRRNMEYEREGNNRYWSPVTFTLLGAYSSVLFLTSLVISVLLLADLSTCPKTPATFRSWISKYIYWIMFCVILNVAALFTAMLFLYFCGYLIMKPEFVAHPRWVMSGGSYTFVLLLLVVNIIWNRLGMVGKKKVPTVDVHVGTHRPTWLD